MPTYDYRCADCGHEFEAQQSFTDDPLTECPSCGGTVKKRFSAVGIAFKGSGFYKNDARGSSGSSSSGSSASSASGPSSGPDASSGSGDAAPAKAAAPATASAD